MAARIRERIFPKWLWRLPPGSRSVALTFDDGPHPDTTPALLETLNHYQIQSTHFVLGARCRENSNLLHDLADSGHEIANHGFQHVGFTFLSSAKQKQSILDTNAVIRNAVGQPSPYFRPPFGRFNPLTARIVQQLGYRGAMWSVMIADWIDQTDDELWRRLKLSLHEGAIIVLHDGMPTTETVIRILPRLAEEIRLRNWDFTGLPSFRPVINVSNP